MCCVFCVRVVFLLLGVGWWWWWLWGRTVRPLFPQECEEHARAVVATITTKSQELDAAKAARSGAQLALAELEARSKGRAEERAALHDKLDTALEAGVVENTAMVREKNITYGHKDTKKNEKSQRRRRKLHESLE